jgi:MinD-like ATPase involved in chromosome partitioning or flagellar assembly
MGLLAIASAKGSPGVTTSAMLFAALWPRPSILVECDPSGGDVALRMPGADGEPLDSNPGLLNLVAAGRKSLYADLVSQHTEKIVGGLDVLTGMTTPEQAAGLGQWNALGVLFAELPGTDTVVDLGRIGAETPQNAILASASAVVLVVDTVPSNVVHLRERLRRVSDGLGGEVGAPLHVVVVAPPKRSRAVAEIRDAIAQSQTPVEAVHHLAHDTTGAGFFLGQVVGSPARTALVRSAQPIVDALAARTAGAFVSADRATTVEQDLEVTS